MSPQNYLPDPVLDQDPKDKIPHNSFTPPKMDEGERRSQTKLFGCLALVAVVILTATIISFFVIRRRRRRAAQKDLENVEAARRFNRSLHPEPVPLPNPAAPRQHRPYRQPREDKYTRRNERKKRENLKRINSISSEMSWD